MKNLIKPLSITSLFIFNICCAQTTMQRVADANNIEIAKKEFVGKPLNFLLSKINVEIKSVLPVPNKNKKEINRICLRFVDDNIYKKTNSKEMNDRPTQICITFNQNWELFGETCRNIDPNCNNWTKNDEKNLGDLIVYNIYVLGKD